MSNRSTLASLIISVSAVLFAALSLPSSKAAVPVQEYEYGPLDQVITIPVSPTFAYCAFNQPTIVPAGLIEKDPDVSISFEQQINRALGKIPVNVLRALNRSGYRITLSENVTDAVPQAKNQQVRGYQPHATWDTVYGMFNRTTRRVVMAEKAKQIDPVGRPAMMPLQDIQRREGILRHECGHAVDQLLGNLSHTPQFKLAYDKGARSISPYERRTLSYYLQPGDAGREETFAEIFASLDEAACDRNSDILLRNHFPELVKMIKDRVDRING